MGSVVVVGLCFASALFYAGAAVVMKVWSGVPFLWIVLPVTAALMLAARVEAVALGGARIGIVVMLIIGFEAACTALFAIFVLGESFHPREVAGVMAILAGTALLIER